MKRRQSIYPAVYNHGRVPIPAAARIGPFIATGNISGFDFGSRTYPETAEMQARNMFAHVRDILAEAGATLDDILKFTVYVQDDAHRAAINAAWIETFPTSTDRPARQTILHRDLPPNRMVACDVLAVAGTTMASRDEVRSHGT